MHKNKYIKIILLGLLAVLMLAGCDTRKPTDVEGPEVNYNINLTSDRYVIYADNGKTVAKVTAILTNGEGEPLQGSTIVFSSLSGAIASNINTNSSGQAIATFDDKGQSGTDVRIIARYTDNSDNTVRDTVLIDILPMEALVASFFATTTPTSGLVVVFQEDSTYSATVSANVRDSSGVAVKNVLVNYRVLEGMDVGYLDGASDSTNALGTSQVTFTNNEGQTGTIKIETFVNANTIQRLVLENPGVYDFGSLLKGTGTAAVVFSDTVTLEYSAGKMYFLELNTLDTTIYLDNGETIARIYAVVKDENNVGLDTIKVNFSAGVGSISSPKFTNDAGIAETEYSDLGANITEDVIAEVIAFVDHPFYGFIRDTVEINIRADNPNADTHDPDRIDLVADCVTLPDLEDPDCVTATRLTATVIDSSGYPVDANTLVTFETDIGVVTGLAVTDENGVALSTFTVGDSAGIATIFARTGAIFDSTLITVRPGGPTYIVIPPSTPNRIVVTGGFGIASTTIRAEVRDASGELTDLAYQVTFELGPNVPAGANLNGAGLSATVESNYGIASVTLNSGTQSGPIRVTAQVNYQGNLIQATAIPVTIAAGPPAFIDADIDINQIDPIGGGQYQAEMAARVWDKYTNPVEDSTQIYWHIEPDSIASVIGGSFTYGENLNQDAYHGLAWSLLYWNSDRTFESIQVIAQTYGANGDTIQGYVNAAEDSTLLLPFYPGNLMVIPSIQFHDFQPHAAPPQVTVTLTAILTDYYNNAIKNGRILFGSIGAASWDPLDPETGMPIVRTDNAGVAQITVNFDGGLCTPNTDAAGDPISYNPFGAQVWGTLLDPQSISSDRSDIQLIRTIQ